MRGGEAVAVVQCDTIDKSMLEELMCHYEQVYVSQVSREGDDNDSNTA